MARLEGLTVGASVTGLAGNSPVSVVAVKWYGNAVLEVTFKNAGGQLASQLLYREDEERLSVADGSLPWSFDADADLLRLTSEAYRINIAHIFDPYLAVHTSAIEPLPHQISAVYQEMLSRLPLRYILADDPGAGKTIMTGLFLKELLVRGDLKRCMIVSPGNLAEQWQDELYRKFNLRFEILTNDRIESAVTGNVFTEANLCIVRLDKLSRNEEIQEKLRVTDWDLIVCDEAHKMSATIWGGEIKYTKRFQLGRLLSSITRHFLLLTATPHNGKEEDFQLFMSLIDQDRFEGVTRSGSQAVDVSDVMRRLVKEDLLKFNGTPLFPERLAYTVNYDLSPAEANLYTAVTEYVQEEFNRADQLNNERKVTVGFALTILQRRLASSPEAIYQSLKRRRERLESRLAEERLGKRASDYSYTAASYEDYDDDDMPSAELEDAEEKVADQASAAQTIAELEAEIKTLLRLERMANDVRQSGVDRKWDELSKLLQDNNNMFGADGIREKLIIFTEHRDTLRYLTDKIRSLLGREEAVVTIHGGLLRDERRKVEGLFKQDKEVRILIATDAAGEGINLRRAHLMVNYDLPWNPNRLEQRFGRIHRIGQTEVCHLWNLVSKETREGMVFQRLFEKLEQEREALHGKVFDVLGKVSFDNKSLKDLILEAVRYGNDPDVRARLYQVVDHSLDRDALQALLDEHALTEDSMDVHQVMAIREDMERMEAHNLQPHFIESFFIEAFTSVGGKIRAREKGRYEITSVPFAVRNRDMQIGFGEPVLQRYERVCFDKPYCNIQGQIPASPIAPGHPLLEATIDLVWERNMDVLKRGAVFVDDTDYSEEPRLLFYVEDSVQDGVILPSGSKRVISKHIHFVEIKEDGSAANAGYAPYLDYRAAKEDEQTTIRAYLDGQRWLQANVEEIAVGYAISQVIPAHVSEVRERKTKLIEVALPLEAINDGCAQEKNPFLKGHPRSTHLWWARRPLAAARAVIFAQMVDDPSSHPDQFLTQEEQETERLRLFGIIEQLVKWENINNEDVLSTAHREILRSWQETCADSRISAEVSELFNPELWTRTVKCPNPACGCEMPLASSFVLSQKKGKEAYVQPVIDGQNIHFEVKYGKNAPEAPKMARGSFKCLCCGELATNNYVKKEAVAGRMGAKLMTIVADSNNGRLYLPPNDEHIKIAQQAIPTWKPDQKVPIPCHDVDRLPMYGMPTWGDAFSLRQLTALSTFSDLVTEAQQQIIDDGGSVEYAQAVCVYLACGVSQLSRYSCTVCGWNKTNENVAQVFGRQAIPMVWDYAEANTLEGSLNITSTIDWPASVIKSLNVAGHAEQADAQQQTITRSRVVSTDPPYYDNISYADLSDFFYVWLRKSLKPIFPDLYATMTTPKAEELVASPYRHGSKSAAETFFRGDAFGYA